MKERCFFESPIDPQFDSLLDAHKWLDHYMRSFVRAIESHAKLTAEIEYCVKDWLRDNNIITTTMRQEDYIKVYFSDPYHSVFSVHSFIDDAHYLDWLQYKDPALSMIAPYFWHTGNKTL